MVELIIGEKGKGKTKHILERAEADLKKAQGNIIFVDKDLKHIFGLDRNIRLIDMTEFDVRNTAEFIGFLSGIISQNNDIEEIILDSFLTIAYLDTDEGLVEAVKRIETIADAFKINFLLSVSRNEDDIPEEIKDKIEVVA